MNESRGGRFSILLVALLVTSLPEKKPMTFPYWPRLSITALYRSNKSTFQVGSSRLMDKAGSPRSAMT